MSRLRVLACSRWRVSAALLTTISQRMVLICLLTFPAECLYIGLSYRQGFGEAC